MQKTAIKLVFLAAITVAGFACTTPETNAPTHRWAGNHAADSVQYHQDHAYCRTEAGIDTNTRAMSAQSPEFADYKQCMTSRGYQLTAYRD